MSLRKCSISASFLEQQEKKLFHLLLRPTHIEALGSILFLPPFTEEMHKSRHIVASQAREFAAAGYNVLIFDLSGCGDSGGEFADVSWQAWLQDAELGADTLAGLGGGPLILWGLRMGALLACELSCRRSDIEKLLLWQPTLNGEQQIDQFLRLRTVPSSAVNQSPFDRVSLWNELRDGRSVEIAGYEVPSRLALGMAKIRLTDLCPGCPVTWVEIAPRPGASISPASDNVITNWRRQGVQVETTGVTGDPFWRIVEAQINPDLQRHTLEILAR